MACTRLPLLASECGHFDCVSRTKSKSILKREPSSDLEIAEAQVKPLAMEHDELRSKLEQTAGQKRKEPPSATPTRDPRKKPRVLEEQLGVKVASQRRISELEGELSSATIKISKLTDRIKYVESDRKNLKANVERYRSKSHKLQMYYETKLHARGENKSISSTHADRRVQFVDRYSRYLLAPGEVCPGWPLKSEASAHNQRAR